MRVIRIGDRVRIRDYTASFFHGVAPYSCGTVVGVTHMRGGQYIRIVIDDGPEIGWVDALGVDRIEANE